MKKYLFFVLLLITGNALAQQEGTFYFMNTISQSTYYNPAFTSKYTTTIGLPGIASNYVGVLNTGFAYNDLFTEREDDSIVVTLDEFYKNLSPNNHFKNQINVDLFHLAFKLNPRMQFTFNITDKNNVYFTYPKEIANLLINGNAPLIGEETSFSVKANGSGYIESGLGLNYQISSNWTVGARFKLLKGYANATTQRANFTINTAENYQIEVVGDVLMNTSGDDLELDDPSYSEFKKYMNNNGFGVDFGVAYKPIDRLTLGFSIVDLGKIKWKNNIKSYELDPTQANFTFKGVDLAKLVNDEEDLGFDLDSLEEKFKFEESAISSYKTTLPPKLYLSGSYELARQLYTNLLFIGEKRESFDLSATANITKNVGRAMTVSLSYTTTEKVSGNWGAGLSFNLAPFQLYVVGDGLLGAGTAEVFNKDINSYIKNRQFFNLRFGINFIGAWEKTLEKLSDDKLY